VISPYGHSPASPPPLDYHPATPLLGHHALLIGSTALSHETLGILASVLRHSPAQATTETCWLIITFASLIPASEDVIRSRHAHQTLLLGEGEGGCCKVILVSGRVRKNRVEGTAVARLPGHVHARIFFCLLVTAPFLFPFHLCMFPRLFYLRSQCRFPQIEGFKIWRASNVILSVGKGLASSMSAVVL
jgi:hypothetical protein